MYATIFADGNEVDAYKCIKSWSDIIDSKEYKSIAVGYEYEDGYGSSYLHVYIRDTLSGEVHEIVLSEVRKIHIVDFPESCQGDVEVYVCIKGDFYTNTGPFFKTEPPKWYADSPEDDAIRNNIVGSLKAIETNDDIFDFVKSFMKIKEGEYIFESPDFDKSEFSPDEIEKLNRCFKKWMNASYCTEKNGPPTITFCNEFVGKWMNF